MPQVQLPQGTIHYGDSGSGPVVLLVHGLLVNGSLWERVVPLLAEDFRVVVPDLPLGSHPEAMHPDADLSPAGVARLIADFMDALDLADVTLVGNDTGGAICQLVAADHPERLARLALTNCDAYENFLPPAFRPLQLLPRIPGGMWLAARAMALPVSRWVFGLLAATPIPPALVDGWVGPARRDPGVRHDVGKVLRRITARDTMRAIAVLRGFDRPTLLAWGRDDPFFAASHPERLATDIPGARLVWIEGAKTFVPLDAPARLAELIRDPDATL
ncbi:alpha/beta fold hydrolase [Pseudonocardia adelaidensis]